MNSASFRIIAYLASAFLLLSEFDSLAARGGGGRGGGGGRAASRGGGGSYSRAGGMGGGGRSAGGSRPSVSGGGYGGGGRSAGGSRSSVSGGGYSGGGRSAGGSRSSVSGGESDGYSRFSSRQSSSRSGGLVPNSNVAGGTLNRSQAAAKTKSSPKGTGTGLPSVAQRNKPGAGAAGNKGFPDLAGKTGGGQIASKAQGAKGGQRAGKVQAAQGGQFAGKLSGAQPGTLAGGMLAGGALAAQGGQLGGRLEGGNLGERANNFSPERNQAIANRQQYWDKWRGDNQSKLGDFKANRNKDWGGIDNFRNNQNLANSFNVNKSEWNNYKNKVNDFRSNRSIEINNNIQNHFDNNFNDNWWGSSGWYRGPSNWGGNPWWWWGAATVGTIGTFLALDAIQDATYQPPIYDYGVNVVYQGDEVYVDGKPTATAEEYSKEAVALANQPSTQPPPPAPPETGQQAEWLPLGVWALAQEEKGDAYMFFQISIDKNGVVTGAYQNVLSGEKSPISGQVDKKTQRVAWKIGSNNSVLETGLQNLTQDVASCLIHFGADVTQTWLLVRLKQPEMPSAPQNATAEAK
jgi:hypothetical protein